MELDDLIDEVEGDDPLDRLSNAMGVKLELDELARARSSSARLGPARCLERVWAEPVFVAREKSELARLAAARKLARG